MSDAPASVTNLFDEGGELGRLMQAHDWSGSAFGTVASWPASLRTLVIVMLGSRQPMFLAWGPERRMLYNDGYATLLKGRHPWALARTFDEVWSDILQDVGPILDRAYAGESTHMDDIAFVMQLDDGGPQERHFSFSYTPVRDARGVVEGMFCACQEITATVMGERARRATEERLRDVLECSSEAFLLLDGAFRLIEINHAGLQFEHGTRATLLGRSLWTLWPGSGEAEVGAALRQAMAERMPTNLEHRLGSEHGGALIELRAYPTGGGELGVFFRDITRRRRAEQALQAAHERHVEILESISDAFYALDRHFQLIYVNRRAEQWWGLSRDKLLGRSVDEVFPAFVGTPSHQALRQAVAERRVVRLETVSVVLGRWIDVSIYPAADAGLSVYFRDIGERKRNELQQAGLLALVERLRVLHRPNDIGHCAAGVLARTLQSTGAGLAAGEGQATLAWLREGAWPDAPEPRFAQAERWPGLLEALCRNEAITIDDVRTDARTAPHASVYREQGCQALLAVPLLDEQRRLAGVLQLAHPQPRPWSASDLGFAQQVADGAWVAAERARAHTALEAEVRERQRLLEVERRRTSQLARLAQASLALGRAATLEAKLEALADAARRILGVQQAAVRLQHAQGETPMVCSTGPGSAAGAFAGSVRPGAPGVSRHVGEGAPGPAEDGAHLEVPLTARDGGTVGAIRVTGKGQDGFDTADEAILVQLAHLGLAAIEQAQAEEALRVAGRRKDAFIATLAHELRNPLSPIRSATHLLQRPNAAPDLRTWAVNVIDRQVRAMALLLDDLLDIARITTGRVELNLQRVALADVVAHAVEVARPLIDKRQHSLSVRLPETALHLQGDELRLSQILSNLLTNAAKYTDAGGHIALSASVSATGDEVLLAVRDSGIGIAPESLAEVFTMFSQVRSAQDRSEGGLGIGLALVKGLVELHGGWVAVASEGVGHGSEFRIGLPLPRGAVVAVPETALAPEGASRQLSEPDRPLPEPQPQAPAEDAAAPAWRILIADDNQDAARTLELLLKLHGHDTRLAFDGSQALALAREFRPDLACLDIGMPGLSGHEVALRLRAEPWAAGLKLVAITGWGSADDKARTQASGFDAHLTKPADASDLLRCVDRLLG